MAHNSLGSEFSRSPGSNGSNRIIPDDKFNHEDAHTLSTHDPHDPDISDDSRQLARKYIMRLAYQRIFGDINNLANIKERPSVIKAAIMQAHEINPRENFAVSEAAILFGINRDTLSSRLAGKSVYMGVQVGK